MYPGDNFFSTLCILWGQPHRILGEVTSFQPSSPTPYTSVPLALCCRVLPSWHAGACTCFLHGTLHSQQSILACVGGRGDEAAQRGDEELDVNWTVAALLGGLYLPLKYAALATVREKIRSQTVIAIMEQTNGLCPHYSHQHL